MKREWYSDLAIPPGEYLEEVIIERGMTKDKLAHRMGRPANELSGLFKGTEPITVKVACKLEGILNVPAHIWLGLESEYRFALERSKE